MARPSANLQPVKEWTELTEGVSVKLSSKGFFSLDWYGAIIHGCRIQQGSNGAFISWPSFQGTGGKWVKRAYVWAKRGSSDEKTLEAVVKAVQVMQ